jgi:RHS repeat-associated protein
MNHNKFNVRGLLVGTLLLLMVGAVPAWAVNNCGNGDSGGTGGKDRDKCKKPKGSNPVKTYSGNVNREIMDLQIWGAVGEIPFVWERTGNSRAIGNAARFFGNAHSWTHSWQWKMTDKGTNSSGQARMEVNYPDGQRVIFTQVSPAEWRPPASIGARIFQNGNNFVLQDSSGWRHRFEKILTASGHFYQMQDILDSQGNLFPLTYESSGRRRLIKVSEPAGRFFQISYALVDGVSVISKVQTNDGRMVQYQYSVLDDGVTKFVLLNGVTYGDGTVASYVHSQQEPGARPVLSHAIDPRYAGMAVNIRYEYLPHSTVRGFIKHELNGITGEIMYTLESDGTLYTATYANGLVDKRTYPASQFGQLSKYVDGLGHVSTYNYSDGGTGFLTREVDPLGRVTEYTPSIYGNHLGIKKPDGALETWTRDDLDLPTSYTDELGRVTTFIRDANHRVTSIHYPDGTSESFTYNSFGQVLTHTQKNGGVEEFVYDATGLLKQAMDALGHVTHYSHDPAGRMSARTDPRGNTTGFEYNERGLLVKTTYPGGVHQSQTYDSFGNRLSIVNELGKTWSYSYDEFRRMKTSTDPLGRITRYDYDLAGGACGCAHTDARPTKVTLPSGKQMAFGYDKVWQLVSETSGAGSPEAATTSYLYDGAGNMVERTDPDGSRTTYTFDLRDRIIAIVDALGNRSEFAYDQSNNLLAHEQPDGKSVEYTYDSMDRLTKIVDPKAGMTLMTYDAESNLLQMKDPRGRNYLYGYDLRNRQTSLKYPDGLAETYAYDALGNMTKYKARGGQTMTCTYDSRNREILCDWSDATPDVNRAYDAAGRVTSMSSTVSELTYLYDDANQLIEETQLVAGAGPTPRTVKYSYDMDGNRAGVAYPSGTLIQWNYTHRNQVASIGVDGPPPMVSYVYDINGKRISKALENGVQTLYSYDAIDRLVSIEHRKGALSLATYQQGFDKLNRKKFVKRSDGKGDVFSYDANDQLVKVQYNATNPNTTPTSPDRVVNYAYDKAGNRLSVNDDGSLTTYKVNGLNQYTNVSGSALTWHGNLGLKSHDGWFYVYDAQTRLKSASKSGTTITFAYDARNRCVLRNENGTKTFFFHDHQDLIEERNASGTLLASYVHGRFIDELLARITPSGAVYYLQDGLGSTTHLTDDSGSVVERYSYDVYGKPFFMAGDGTPIGATAVGNRFLYTGREYLATIDLYDYRNRFYSHALGRFLQADPIRFNSGDINLYSYVLNSPVNLVDPTGLDELAPLDSKGGRRDLSRADANKEIHPGGPLPKDVKKDIDRGCIGLCAAYQGLGEVFPEQAPNTNCYLTEAEADKRKCKCGEENFVFAKQGQWKGGKAPKPDPKSGKVPNDSVSSAGGNYNYVTKFPSTKSYAWMNHAVGLGFTPQKLSIAPTSVKDPHYPHEIWCSTCKKKK